MDFKRKWEDIEDKPTSSAADIDLAVASRHTHSNAETLAHLGEDDAGKLTYKGSRVYDGLAWIANANSLEEIPTNLHDNALVLIPTAAFANAGTESGGDVNP